MQIFQDRRSSSVKAIFEDIDVKRISGFHIQYVSNDKEASIITCWLDSDDFDVTDKYIKIDSKKNMLISYIPTDKVVKVEIIK